MTRAVIAAQPDRPGADAHRKRCVRLDANTALDDYLVETESKLMHNGATTSDQCIRRSLIDLSDTARVRPRRQRQRSRTSPTAVKSSAVTSGCVCNSSHWWIYCVVEITVASASPAPAATDSCAGSTVTGSNATGLRAKFRADFGTERYRGGQN